MPEKDFGFWIPVRASATREGERANVASPLAWFQPCLWVDSGPAVTEGREVETPTRATSYRKFRAHAARHQRRLFPLASHPIAEHLGLLTVAAPFHFAQATICESFLALEVEFGFAVEPGRVVHDVLK